MLVLCSTLKAISVWCTAAAKSIVTEAGETTPSSLSSHLPSGEEGETETERERVKQSEIETERERDRRTEKERKRETEAR